MSNDCLIGFGSNLGDSRLTLQSIVDQLKSAAELDQIQVSRPVVTAPTGAASDAPKFVNAVIRLATDWTPIQLLDRLAQLEREYGRQRRQRWGNRTVDLDILLCGLQRVATQTLTVPHPRMTYRRFVLTPALEVAAQMMHPVTGCSIQELHEQLDQRRNRILVISNSYSDLPSAHDLAEAVDGEFKMVDWSTQDTVLQANPDTWALRVHEGGLASVPTGDLRRAKLTVFFGDQADLWNSSIQGPYLVLKPECESSTFIRELHASMQAMSPWTS